MEFSRAEEDITGEPSCRSIFEITRLLYCLRTIKKLSRVMELLYSLSPLGGSQSFRTSLLFSLPSPRGLVASTINCQQASDSPTYCEDMGGRTIPYLTFIAADYMQKNMIFGGRL